MEKMMGNAMHVYPTAQVPKETHIIESAPHLMPSQLDTVAGDLLKRQASNGVDNLCKVFPAAIILYLLLYSFIMTTYSFTNFFYCEAQGSVLLLRPMSTAE